MTTYTIKRIYDDSISSDGYRVLVDRLWPRGVSKEKANLDEWAKEIAPSTDLRQYFDHQESRFQEFSLRYRHELDGNDVVQAFLCATKKYQHVTLLYGARDPEINHAVVLQKWLTKHQSK